MGKWAQLMGALQKHVHPASHSLTLSLSWGVGGMSGGLPERGDTICSLTLIRTSQAGAQRRSLPLIRYSSPVLQLRPQRLQEPHPCRLPMSTLPQVYYSYCTLPYPAAFRAPYCGRGEHDLGHVTSSCWSLVVLWPHCLTHCPVATGADSSSPHSVHFLSCFLSFKEPRAMPWLISAPPRAPAAQALLPASGVR